VTAFIPAHSESFSFLPDPVSDNLIQVVIELGSAYWVMRRRMLILERLLEQGGAVTAEQIETYVPTPEETREWAALRDGFTQRVYGALTRPPAELPPGDR
jgi:hypothetical protein